MWTNLLKLLGLIPFGPIFAAVTKYPLQFLIALLLVTNGGTYYLWQRASDNYDHEKAAHVQTVKDFRKAQDEANAKAEAKRKELKKEAEANAKQADKDYANLLDRYNANLMRFKASQSATLGPDYHQLPATQGGDGPSGNTEFPEGLIISLADAKICAVNTARLHTVHDWAVSLPKE